MFGLYDRKCDGDETTVHPVPNQYITQFIFSLVVSFDEIISAPPRLNLIISCKHHIGRVSFKVNRL